jgi:hypothetical protein
MEDSKYDGLFTTDKNLIQTVIESSPYSEEIDPKGDIEHQQTITKNVYKL